MTDNTGEPQQRPEDEPGYWEKKAAEEAVAYPAPPAYPAPGAPAPVNPYAAPPYGGQPGSPQPHGLPGFPTYVLPDLPKATTALVLGLVALGGTLLCLLPIVVSPFAWAVGASARKEIRNAPNQWGGESKATAGMVLGIIGTVLLALGLVAIAIFVIFAVATSSDAGSSGTGV